MNEKLGWCRNKISAEQKMVKLTCTNYQHEKERVYCLLSIHPDNYKQFAIYLQNVPGTSYILYTMFSVARLRLWSMKKVESGHTATGNSQGKIM